MTITAMVEQCINSGVVLTVLEDGRLSFTGKTKLPIAQQLFAIAKEDRSKVVAALHEVTNPSPQPMQADIFSLHDVAEMEPDLPADADAPLTPLTPMLIRTNKPALPEEQWLDGLSQLEALAAKRRLGADYFCTVGMNSTHGYFVRADPAHYEVMLNRAEAL